MDRGGNARIARSYNTQDKVGTVGYWTDGGMKIGVFGLGRSGCAASALLHSRGFTVVGFDLNPNVPRECDFFFSGESIDAGLREIDGLVLSPGVDPLLQPIVHVRELGIPVIGEIELAYRNCNSRILAVTGSNGKTTTSEWLGYTLGKAGINTCVAGNTGYAFSRAILEKPDTEIFVLEISSYQLQTIEEFRPEGAAVLNITPDHLVRHGSFENYRDAKARLFLNQSENDLLVLNEDDPDTIHLSGRGTGLEMWFSVKRRVKMGACTEHGTILYLDDTGEYPVMQVKDISLPGEHNLANALAVICLAAKAGLEPAQMTNGLSTFKGVPHRIELIRELDGVEYLNDSKSTNPESLIVALKSNRKPIILIAGGSAKKADYSILKELISERVKAIILIGEASEELMISWKGSAPIHLEGEMNNAVNRASLLASSGDAVLLSPGCASFDQYRDFEERGEHFRTIVERL